MVGVPPVDATAAILVIGCAEFLRQAGRMIGTHVHRRLAAPPCSRCLREGSELATPYRARPVVRRPHATSPLSSR